MNKISLPPSGLAEDILSMMGGEPDAMHLVTFSLGEQYGVRVDQVQEIIRVGAVTRVPNSPDYIDGVINLRGRVLPVFNLRRRLGLPIKETTKLSRIVVTEVGKKEIGLVVDAVSHVVKVPPGFVEAAPEEVLEVDTDYITGVGKLNDQLIILLDLEKLLRREKIELKET